MPPKRVEMHYFMCYNSYMSRKNNYSVILEALFWLFIGPFYLIYLIFKGIFGLFLKNKYETTHEDIRTRNYSVKSSYKRDNFNNYNNTPVSNLSDNDYSSKNLVTECEKDFLNIIDDNFGSKFRIVPQVPLSSIVDKNKTYFKQYQNELFRTIDIGIFDKRTFKPLLMIEINDKTHLREDRHERDLKVQQILSKANISLLIFYPSDCNNERYIVDSIIENL